MKAGVPFHLPLQKGFENRWNNEILYVGPKRLGHFCELEETCAPVLVSELFLYYKQLLDVSVRALLSDLILLSQKRKLNLSSASGVSTEAWDGGRDGEVGQRCSKFFLLYPCVKRERLCSVFEEEG